MTPIEGTAVLAAAAMRAAERAAMDAGADAGTLMDRAGRGAAEAVRRLAGDGEVLVLCGPGNNGGDGYVIAATLLAAGRAVRVAVLGEPAADPARAARARWTGEVAGLADATPAPVLVDALFGTGLSRPLADEAQEALARLAEAAVLRIAVDLPSGVTTDEGAMLGRVPRFDLTLALGAVKPAHLLQPAAHVCGAVRVIDIGVPVENDWRVLAKPMLAAPGPAAHKYTRGMVAIAAGSMAGAAELAAEAAMRVGAGYVTLLGGAGTGRPHALVRRALDPQALGDERIGALLVGPGLGRDEKARATLEQALATAHPLVIDGDALHLIDPGTLAGRRAPVVLTPHAGEFKALFGEGEGSKIARALDAARRAGAVVVFKGADTVIAAPDGRVRIAPDASSWLSTAGTGDVLAGAIAGVLAGGLDPLDAAAAGVWLHGDAARRAGRAFIADDLVHHLTDARAGL